MLTLGFVLGLPLGASDNDEELLGMSNVLGALLTLGFVLQLLLGASDNDGDPLGKMEGLVLGVQVGESLTLGVALG